jgi:hypothetical protein
VSKDAVAAFFGSSERSESASDGLCTGAAGVAGKPIDKEVARHSSTPLELAALPPGADRWDREIAIR